MSSRPISRLDLSHATIPFITKLKGIGVFDCHTHGRFIATFQGDPTRYCADCGGALPETEA